MSFATDDSTSATDDPRQCSVLNNIDAELPEVKIQGSAGFAQSFGVIRITRTVGSYTTLLDEIHSRGWLRLLRDFGGPIDR